ncbi:MAG: hypothetical protein M3247_07500 [Thermoproteota archaeon]|nr:hypothetical protein [Thermoproteota archaeon]
MVQGKPFWIWDIAEHTLEDIKTDGDCCFNHDRLWILHKHTPRTGRLVRAVFPFVLLVLMMDSQKGRTNLPVMCSGELYSLVYNIITNLECML